MSEIKKKVSKVIEQTENLADTAAAKYKNLGNVKDGNIAIRSYSLLLKALKLNSKL